MIKIVLVTKLKLYLLNNIWMFDSFKQGDLSNGCTRDTVILFLEFNLLESYDLNNHKNLLISIQLNYESNCNSNKI